ncbi:MAG: hypothetical protein C0404_14560 [Verrucomicrobia bacterium]|nr:hypothetical protein [Verrucomicrobiota bacterium]
MKTRLVVVILLLVVVPTALLSVMAGRALRNREAVLQQGLELAAMNAINGVAAQVNQDLARNLEHVRLALAQCIARGGEYKDLEAVAKQLKTQRPMVNDALVFMNPWGFVYPDIEKPDAGGRSRAEVVVPALRRAIVTSPGSNSFARFTIADGSYCFAPVEGKKDLYVGFRVDPEGFRKQLVERLGLGSKGGFTVVAEGPDFTVVPPGGRLPGEIIVSDSLDGDATVERDNDHVAGGPGEKPLATGRLQKPFDHIRLSAYVSSPGEAGRAAEYEGKLYVWGIVLLALAVLSGVCLIVGDAITEIRRARSQSDFVIGVSHDLRTPLASMRMLAESLYTDHVADPEKRRKFLGTIMKESERLGQLIERVLFFVRFGQDALVFHPQRTGLGQLVNLGTHAFLSSKLHTGGPEPKIQVRIQPDLPHVMADETALVQVVLNLLDNAWKYGSDPRGGADRGVEVDVAAWRGRRHLIGVTRTWVRMSVTDHGAGIGRKHLRRVFRKYYRVPGSAAMNVSGVGLGLALCRHIVANHGGWIEAKSEPGKGSTFSIYLPAEGMPESD